MDGELLVKFIIFKCGRSRGPGMQDYAQNIILKNENIGDWKRFVILPAKIRQKVSVFFSY